jgi:lysozyme family protein
MERREYEVIQWIMAQEGGFNCLKSDAGGMTIMGIARKFNPDCQFWKLIDNALTDAEKSRDITGSSATSRRITDMIKSNYSAMQEIQSVYDKRYWIASRAYTFGAPLDLIIMDGYFNMGAASSKILQQWCGAVQDGIIGRQTVAAIGACKCPISDLLIMRWRYYQTRPTFKIFGNGWRNRLIALAKKCNIVLEFK